MVFSVAIRGGKAKVAQRLSWRLCSATCSCNLFPLYGMCKEKSTFLLAPQACRHFCPPFNTGETYRLFSCDNIQFSSFFLPQGRELRPGSSSLAEGSTAKPQEFVSSLRALRWLSLQHCLPGDQEGASLRWESHRITEAAEEQKDHRPITLCPLTTSLIATSTRLLNTCKWWLRCLTALLERKCFLISNLNLPCSNLRPFFVLLSLFPARRGWHAPHHSLLSGTCRQQWGLPWASPSPEWTIPVPLAAPLPSGLVLQAPHLLSCPSLDTLQGLNTFLVVLAWKLNTVFKVWTHQSWVQRDDFLPASAGSSVSGPPGHTAGLCSAVNWHLQILFLCTAFQALWRHTSRKTKLKA